MNSFWNNGAGMSGGDQRMIQIFSRIGNNFDIDIYTTADGKAAINGQIPETKYFIAPNETNRGRLIFSYKKRVRWASCEILKHHYDIVYGSSDFFPDVTPCYKYKTKHPDAKWIQLIHHLYPSWHKRPGNKIRNFVAEKAQLISLSLVKKKADLIINVSREVSDRLTSRGFERKKIAVVPNGIDINFFSKIKAKKQAHSVSFLARLSPSKGIFDLINIISELKKIFPDIFLHLIGGGSDAIKKELIGRIKEKGLTKNIRLHGFLKEDQAFPLIKSTQVFMFPSHEEGFGISIAEAMASGLPVVAWNLPVYDEVFPKGLVQVKEGDNDQFARKVIEIIANDKIRQKIAIDGLEMVQKYSWDKIAQEELKIINNLII